MEKSLKIKKEIGDKQGIASSLHNLGALYTNKKIVNNNIAITYFIEALSIFNNIGAKLDLKNTKNWIVSIRNEIGLELFKPLVVEAVNKLDGDMKKHIPIHELLNEPIKIENKIGRNDPCTCGSGKKYKSCHGKNS